MTTNATTAKRSESEIAEMKKDVTTMVLDKVRTFQESGALVLPKDYNAPNAIKSAYIVLSDPKNNLLEKCSPHSIANALLKMVVYGVTPLKGQCYFIPYKDQLECQVSYTGNIATAKRYGHLKSIKGNAIFEGDEFAFRVNEDGRKELLKHVQSLNTIGGKVIGAYAIIEMEDGTKDMEVMNMDMIRKAWGQGGAKGASQAHATFPDQMAIKTVINRACKLIIRSSDDQVLATNQTPEQQEEDLYETTERVEDEIESQANTGEVIDFEELDDEPKGATHEAPTAPRTEDAPF